LTVKRKIILAVVLLAVIAVAAVLTRAWFYAAEKISQPGQLQGIHHKTVSEKLIVRSLMRRARPH